MNQEQLEKLLKNLISLPNETETVEFKENNFSPEDIGKRISALSNSANLHNKKNAYLVFGIHDISHDATGTTFLPSNEKIGNDQLEFWLSQHINPRIDFRIHEFEYNTKDIVIFEIPPAINQPIKFNNIAYISDYNISVAKRLVRGADVWLNTPIKGKEASGTSGMKSALNGVIQCSVEDGWIEEVRDNAAIFVLDQHKTSADFYNILENKISSEYYERDGDNFPVLWAERMKSTRDIVLKSFLAERMFGEYMDLMYFPTTATKMKL